MSGLFRTLSIALLLTWPGYRLQAQQSAQLIAELDSIHRRILNTSCANQQVISNRAMNLYLSDRVGSYLADYKNLSFYKNYVTFNTRDGVFSLNHNFFQATGVDEPVRSFLVVGVKANVMNALASTFTDKPFRNELGATLKKAWIGKPKTTINNCREKNLMDTKRSSILNLLKREIENKEADFIKSIDSLKQEGLSDSTLAHIKAELSQNFYAGLRDEFSRRFASLQYLELAETARYKQITTHWTTLNAYLPFILQRYTVASSFAQVAETKKNYPFELSLIHTRFWESKKRGRLFLSFEGRIVLNNSIQSFSRETISYSQYTSLGGLDTLTLKQRAIRSLYIGDYASFLTPGAKISFVYYPAESHIGLSSSLEQNMGTYRALNWTIGIPVVLIDKAGAPSANFEFQLNYSDVTRSFLPGRKTSDRLSIGLTIAVPFSKIIY
ncbi:hypothetical protein [Spirosoma sp.]|uniref:hypothetical protein n=1 Tax=Spirosoma sp. TaxID=1899569 RepID=UPI00262A1BCC|nr:hypothetical protein [Spirosoma sp.]MCX6216703.1 hypothetical protein [Spirosoma sp.]